MESLPVELMTLIAEHTDDATLQALVKTSRRVQAGPFSTFGNRFFRTIKFYMYANSLQVLTDISYTPRLVGFVRNVAFGTENVGLIDPIHDVDVREGRFMDLPTNFKAISMGELLRARGRVDSAIISQALMRFPKLEMLVIGQHFGLDGSKLPSAKCAAQI